MTQLAYRMGSLSQRAMLCHRGHHETREVWSWKDFQDLYGGFEMRWILKGKKCKHCGRWV